MIHLTVDLLGCCRFPDDESAGAALLQSLASMLNMRALAPPTVVKLENGTPNHGVSGTLIIAESHIAFHTWPEHRQAYLDVFSCREFSCEAVVDCLQTYFGAAEVRSARRMRAELGTGVNDAIPA